MWKTGLPQVLAGGPKCLSTHPDPAAPAAAKSLQLCPTLCLAAHQAPLSLGFSRQEYWSGLPFPSPMHACMLSHLSCVRLCVTPWTAAHQAPLSTGFSRQEYWSGLPFPSPMHACMLSCFSHVQLCETLWTAAHQASLSTGFSRQEYWSGLPFPSPFKHLLYLPHERQWALKVKNQSLLRSKIALGSDP